MRELKSLYNLIVREEKRENRSYIRRIQKNNCLYDVHSNKVNVYM